MACPGPAKIYQMPDESYADHFTSNDRKLLIEMAVKMERMGKDVEQIQQSGNNQYTALRAELITDTNAIEMRVRTLENFRWWLLGAVAFGSPVIAAVTTWLLRH